VFDHVTLRVSDLARSKLFYDRVFSTLEFRGAAYADDHLLEWNDFSLYEGEPLTRRLHVGFAAPSRGHVDAFWRALVDAGYRDDGASVRGPRTGRTTTAPSSSIRTGTGTRLLITATPAGTEG
jgi:catechol 2,3-dioxygenase-like lactoylglutathione lyase family enzyme